MTARGNADIAVDGALGSPAERDHPRVCVIGPMVGRHHGRVTHQGQIVADALRDNGYDVLAVSAHTNRYMRLLDIVASLIRRGRRIDVLLLQIYGERSFVVEDIASWIARRFGHRVVMVLHGGAIPRFIAGFPRWTRRVFQRADVIVAPSAFMARAVRAHGLPVRIVPNTIHLEEYEYRHRSRVQPRLLWMRSFHETYNPMMAIRTLSRLRQWFPEASLVMAGQDNGLQEDTRVEAARLGLDGAVRFPGFLDAASKRRESRDADIFLNTNRIDNMPVAIVEAGAMGLPVVATNVGGIPDLLTDGKTGVIVPDDDDAAMADAVRRLVLDADLAGRLSLEGRRLAEQCSWAHVQPQWEAIFSEIMTSRPARGNNRARGSEASPVRDEANGSVRQL